MFIPACVHVCEFFLIITPQVAKRSEIKKVKVLGSLAMIDEGTYDIIVGPVAMATYR